jgi:hypothetical protein
MTSVLLFALERVGVASPGLACTQNLCTVKDLTSLNQKVLESSLLFH